MDVHKNRGSADIEYKSKVNEFVSGGIHKLGMRIAPEMPGHKKNGSSYGEFGRA